jgi:CDP-diacylglycerol--glycerol-3-phosphate 3-phosphatidyltransferase
VLASLTDFLDGYLARRWQVVSPLGTFLDPVADKLLVALMLVYLLMEGGAAYASLLFLPVVVIVLRELFVSALREFLAARSIALPVSRGGKWKTALQMLAITLLLAAPVVAADAAAMVAQAGRCALYLAAILAFTSALQYARAGLKSLP